MITSAQAWYVATVYPESVSPDEAREDFDKRVLSEADRTYWESAAKILNTMARNLNVPDEGPADHQPHDNEVPARVEQPKKSS